MRQTKTLLPFFFFLFFTYLNAQVVFTNPDKIRYDGACLTIDGEDKFIYSAAFHYFRCPEELWRDRFRDIKAAGFNTVETYVPWNWHERKIPNSIDDNSNFDFADLRRWLKMAHQEFGLYTIVRPGPFICAEFSGGAYPRWLAKFRPENYEGFWLRSADEQHIKWSLHWFDAVCKELVEDQITQKPKGEKGIILIQIENEYDAHGCDNKENFLNALYKSVRNSGMDIPVFTCLTSQCRGSKEGLMSQVFDCDNYYVGSLSDAPSCAHRMASLKRAQPNAPGYVTELQGGWFSLVTGGLSEDHYSNDKHFKAMGLMTMLGGGTGINYYMFFGGTHFDGWGARGMTTTYDYNAAIREHGALSPKYYAAKEIGDFIANFESQLTRSEGGPCELANAPKELFGGLRIAADGTKFIFLHNTDPKNAISGTSTLLPGSISKPTEPIYNINQHGQRVLMVTQRDENDTLAIEPITVSYEIPPLETSILVVKPGKDISQGEWWPRKQAVALRPSSLPSAIVIKEAKRCQEPYKKALWEGIEDKTSLSQKDINDFRYSLYRSTFKLSTEEVLRDTLLLLNMFTRDIVSVTVNGIPASRLFPDNADAQSWTTRNCFERIKEDEFDNRFNVAGLLKKGKNEIVAVYENLGHAHGYVPMEELSGIRKGGLSSVDTEINRMLKWEFSADLAGVTQGWIKKGISSKDVETVKLKTEQKIERKGNNIQPKSSPDGLLTWWEIEFDLPENPANCWIPWRMIVNASGNGYMWLNGNNIGRHWEAGAQREFFLPECWLNFGGKNRVVFGLRQTKNGALLNAVEISPYENSATIK